MLDSLLGRKELKDQIAELEAERDSLNEQLEAERRRRRDAVSDRQTAEERVNRLEDRIAELEDRVSRQQSQDDSPLELRHRATLRGSRLRTVLDRVESIEAPSEGAVTAAVTDSIPEPIEEILGERTALLRSATPCVVCVDDAHLISVALDPPVHPTPFCDRGPSFALDRSWFEPTGEFAMVLVRSDVFAVGRYQGTDRRNLQGFQTDVKSNHSKGGFSQGRFERIREGQIADHLDRAKTTLDDLDVDRCYVVGTAQHLDAFEEYATATAPVDATGDPETALDEAFHSFWTTHLSVL